MSIELKNISKKVGNETHIHNMDIILEPNKFNILLGSTLSGKTTLMRLMAGLDKPSSGEIWLNGKNITTLPIQKRNVAMVYQQFINYPGFSVYDNIASPLVIKKENKKVIKEKVGEIVSLLKLEPFLDRFPAELSGGQQQRVALGRALIKNATLVLLDEPLANLDYKLREELREELPKLFHSTKTTIVYATTEPLEALLLEGNVTVLHEGRMIQSGKTIDVYEKSNSLQSAISFSDPHMNIVSVTKKNDFIILHNVKWDTPTRLKNKPNGQYTMGIRPHHCTINNTKKDYEVLLQGKVEISEMTGLETLIHFYVEGHKWISLNHSANYCDVGSEITVALNTQKCMYFDNNGEVL